MKRFFQILDRDSSSSTRDYTRQQYEQGAGPASHSSGGSFIGKTFVIGQYHCTVEDVIAEGGFSLVFLVKANNGIRYALKRLYVNNEHDLDICKREIEIARKLGSHKNIVQMVESSINYCGNDVHEIFMLMQYCKGQLLHLMNDKINTGFTETEIIRILCDLCEAIGRMHHNDPPIIHRDLKIENILISDDGNYMLCDFGSATTKPLSLDNGQSALSIDEEIKRYTTLAYRSPEMVDVYSGKSINTKADIWALGCLLYKLCYFSLPFGESTLAIQNAQLTIPDSHSDRYSQRLSSLIAYMLTANPEKRPDIYQVSYLTFSLTGNECPLKNFNKSSIPSWSDLRVPPTETQARELKRIVPPSTNINSSYQSTNAYQQANYLDTEKATTTTVTPRQRPKASININSVLATSPVAFQRSHTPSNNNNNNNNNNTSEIASNLSVKDHHGLTNSHSFTSSSQLFSKTDQANNNRATNYSKAEKQLPTFASNPNLNKNNNENSFTKQPSSSTNHNPFLTSASVEETVGTGSGNGSHQSSSSSTTTANDVPPPPPPRNQSLTFLENQTSNAETISPNIITNTITTAPTTHQHRRNMSDSSAFSIKNQDNVKQKQQVGRGAMLTSNNLGSQLQSVSNEFMDGGGHQQSRNRSLNPFDDSIDDYSYEDQLFGKEFDKIRSETKQVKEPDNNPFEAAPLNQERLKRFLDKKLQKPPSTTKIIITDNYETNENEDPSNQKKQSTVITIKSDKEFTIVANSQQKKLDPSDAADESGDQLSKMTSNKSISSSSQGGIATSPTTNYMPLYSSDTADDDDLDEYGIRLRHGRRKNPSDDDNDEDRGLTMSVNQNHIDLIPHYEATGDMTEPLVEDDDDEEDDEDNEHDVIENPNSSIGSASDLITDSDDEDDDSQDNHNSSSNSSEFMELNDDNSSRHDSDNENKHDIRIKYGLVKNPSATSDQLMIQSSTSNSKPSLNIAKIQIRPNKTINTINLQNIDDGTSISNSSMRSDSQKNIDSLDHLIGHVEGHRPLLEDEDEDDINLPNTTTAIASSSSSSIVTTKSLISMDQPPLIFDSDVSDSKYYHSKTASLPQVEKLNSFQTGDIYPPSSQVNTNFIPSHSSSNSLHSDFVSLSLTNQPMEETNEENRHLDEEVERSLQTQVIYDQKNNKDLFGSIPFTDKELINHSILQQENAAAAAAATITVSVETKKPENTNRFENSFADLPVSGIKSSETLKEQQKTIDAMNVPLKSTDLFGAIPFSSSTQSTKNDTKTQIIKIPQPPQPTKNLLNKNVNLSSSSMVTTTMRTIPSMQQTSKPEQPKFVQSLTKTLVSPSTSSQSVISTTTSPPPTTATTLSNTGISKLSRNQFQRSNLKIKSKVAKKYEVDESDDEVDGLLDPLENDDLILDNDTVEPTLDFSLKKKKKDKKEKEKSEKKSKEPKVKEKKEEKKSKNKEKPDKAAEKIKNKEDKKKEKKEKEKEKKKDKKDKESKEKSKDKSSRKTSSDDVSVVTGSQPITITSTDSVDSVTTKIDSKNKMTSSSTATTVTMTLNKDGGKLKKSSSGTKQAFANMSFEDEIQHHSQQQRLSTSNSNNNVTITRC